MRCSEPSACALGAGGLAPQVSRAEALARRSLDGRLRSGPAPPQPPHPGERAHDGKPPHDPQRTVHGATSIQASIGMIGKRFQSRESSSRKPRHRTVHAVASCSRTGTVASFLPHRPPFLDPGSVEQSRCPQNRTRSFPAPSCTPPWSRTRGEAPRPPGPHCPRRDRAGGARAEPPLHEASDRRW